MAPTVYLITGANRGLGLAFVTVLASRKDTVVFAGARNPDSAKELHELAAKHPGVVHVVKLSATDEAENRAAVAKVKEVAGRLDVAIANAGITGRFEETLHTPVDTTRELLEVMALGPLILFQAAYPLMKATSDNPKYLLMSSIIGSIEVSTRIPSKTTEYGMAKAAANWFGRRLHYEYPGLAVLIVHPGSVATDMLIESGKKDSVLAGAVPTAITPEKSARDILGLLDNLKRDEENGPKLMVNDGSVLPW